MGYYEKNSEVLTKRFPHLKDHLNDIDDQCIPGGEDIEGRHVMYLQAGDDVVQLDSLYDMDPVLDLWVQTMQKPPMYAKVFLFGFGNGCMARKLLEKLDDSNKVIVYEPDFTILHYAMEHFDLTEIFNDPRFDLIVRSAVTGIVAEQFDRRISYTDISSLQYYIYPNYNYIYLEAYLEYISEFENACNAINSTQSVLERFTEANFLNTFANMNAFLVSKSVEDLYMRLPHDFPAIIVASGPSLDKNVHLLAEAKNKAFIIAVDSSLRSVLKTGIVPDLCVTIDAKKLSKHFSDDRANDIPMICYLTSNRAILKNHRAAKFFINDLNHHVQHFFSQHNQIFPVVSTGGSVANNAFSIAQMLGFQTIIMIGQDLAYTDNRTHSAASVRGERNIDASTLEHSMTEGIDGKPIATSNEFTLYRTWIQEQIVQYPELNIIDATEGGAKIYGSKIMTFKEAIDTYCRNTCDFEKIISETDDFIPMEERKELVEYIYGIPDELKECLRKAKEGTRIYEQMLKLVLADKYHNERFKNEFEKTKSINTFLDKAPVMEYVKNEIQNETNALLKTVYEQGRDERSELLASCRMGIDYLKVMEKGIQTMIERCTEQIQQVHL
ncbi:MAG: motility associated factor glycosyltransferase family protein [Lachnospiraceae bacterium]|nr:motility associated factor glycosyltransferase family protein [Lachnospiraceae bacterium]